MGDNIGGGGALSFGGVSEDVMSGMMDALIESNHAQDTASKYRNAVERGEEINPDDYTVYLGGIAFRPVTEIQAQDS